MSSTLVDRLQEVRCDREPFTPEHATCICRLTNEAANEIERLRDLVAAHEEVHEDHKRLVRELDVALNGEEGAAPQASLCDIVCQLTSPRRKSLTQI